MPPRLRRESLPELTALAVYAVNETVNWNAAMGSANDDASAAHDAARHLARATAVWDNLLVPCGCTDDMLGDPVNFSLIGVDSATSDAIMSAVFKARGSDNASVIIAAIEHEILEDETVTNARRAMDDPSLKETVVTALDSAKTAYVESTAGQITPSLIPVPITPIEPVEIVSP